MAGGGGTQTAGEALTTASAAATATGVGAPIGIGLMAIGAGLSIFGSISSAQDQAKIDQEKQQQEEAQAAEVGRREAANEVVNQQVADVQRLDIGSELEGHGSANIGSQLEIQRQADLKDQINRNESEFQQAQLMAGGSLYGQQAQDTLSAGYLSAGATLLSTAGKVVTNPATGLVSYGGTPQSLPQIGDQVQGMSGPTAIQAYGGMPYNYGGFAQSAGY